jgi:hypothetical protein
MELKEVIARFALYEVKGRMPLMQMICQFVNLFGDSGEA